MFACYNLRFGARRLRSRRRNHVTSRTPRLESLERRALLTTLSSSSQINIDSAWLSSQGSAPYVLSQPNTTYVLETDISTPGTAFVVAAPNVAFDLNGHTVTYGNVTPVVVANGGFEQVSGRSVPGWNLNSASSAAIAPNTDGLFGSQVLKFSNLKLSKKAQYIVSDPISIPEANHT